MVGISGSGNVHKCEVAIIGGGPAGSTTAALLTGRRRYPVSRQRSAGRSGVLPCTKGDAERWKRLPPSHGHGAPGWYQFADAARAHVRTASAARRASILIEQVKRDQGGTEKRA